MKSSEPETRYSPKPLTKSSYRCRASFCTLSSVNKPRPTLLVLSHDKLNKTFGRIITYQLIWFINLNTVTTNWESQKCRVFKFNLNIKNHIFGIFLIRKIYSVNTLLVIKRSKTKLELRQSRKTGDQILWLYCSDSMLSHSENMGV